eukprot:734196-Prymnesium_polylepis.1
MGLDPAHMSYAGLSQRVAGDPAGVRQTGVRAGMPGRDVQADRESVGRAVRFWLRGAGEARPGAVSGATRALRCLWHE